MLIESENHGSFSFPQVHYVFRTDCFQDRLLPCEGIKLLLAYRQATWFWCNGLVPWEWGEGAGEEAKGRCAMIAKCTCCCYRCCLSVSSLEPDGAGCSCTDFPPLQVLVLKKDPAQHLVAFKPRLWLLGILSILPRPQVAGVAGMQRWNRSSFLAFGLPSCLPRLLEKALSNGPHQHFKKIQWSPPPFWKCMCAMCV